MLLPWKRATFLPCLQTQIHVAMSIVDVVGIVAVDGFLGAAKQKGKMSFGSCTPLACVGKELLDIGFVGAIQRAEALK